MQGNSGGVGLTTTSGDITLAASVASSVGTVRLTAAGAITQTGGSINAGNLTGSSAGATVLTAAGNVVGRLNAFTALGGFNLTDSTALIVVGAVNAGTNNLTLATTGAGNGVTLSSSLTTSAAGTVTLNSAGIITETGSSGLITAGSFVGTSTGGAGLTGANQIATLGGFTNSGVGGVTLNDAISLTVGGAVSSGGNSLLLQSTGLNFAGGSLNSGAAATTLLDTNTTNGTIVVGDSGSAPYMVTSAMMQAITAGTLRIASAGNGNIVFASASTGLSVSNLTLATSGTIALSGVDTLNNGASGTLSLSGSSITQDSAGVVQSGTLNAVAATGAVSLIGNNAIQTLGSGTAAGAFTLNNAGTLIDGVGAVSGSSVGLSVTGGDLSLIGSITANSAAGSLSLTASGGKIVQLSGNSLTSLGTGTTALSLMASGDVSLAGTVSDVFGTVSLTSTAGAVNQIGGSVVAATLKGGSAASTTLSGTGNVIQTLAAFSATGGFSLADQASTLTVAGAVTTTGQLSLTTPGAITEVTGGRVTAATMVGSAGGGLTFSGANAIATLDAFTVASGGFQYTGTGIVTVGGVINSSNTQITLTGTGVQLLPGGQLMASSATVTLMDSSSSTMSVGTGGGFDITNATLLRIKAGHIIVQGSGAGVLDNVSTAAWLTLNAGSGISVVGNNTVTTQLTLNTNGTVNESGTISTHLLTGTVAGAVHLNDANSVTNLGNFSAGAGFSLTNASALTVSGPVTSSKSTVSLTTTGAASQLTLSGTITAGDTITLTSAAGISQTDGALVAPTLTGSAAQGVSLTQAANAISNLGGFTVAGDGGLALNSSVSMTVNGSVSTTNGVASITIGGAAQDLILNGAISTSNLVVLQASGSINQNAGSVAAGEVELTAGGSAVLGSGSNQFPAVTGHAGGNFSVYNSGFLTELGISAGGYIELNAGAGSVTFVNDMSAGTGVKIDVNAAIADDVSITSQGGSSLFAGTVQSASSGSPAAFTFTSGSGSVTFMNNIGAGVGSGTGLDQVPITGSALKWINISGQSVVFGSGQSDFIVRTVGNGTSSAPTVQGTGAHLSQGDILFGSDPVIRAGALVVDVTNAGLAFNSAGTIDFGNGGLVLSNGKLIVILGNGLAIGSLIDTGTLDVYGTGGATDLFGGIAGNFSQNAVREPFAEHYTALTGFFSQSSSPNTDYKFNGCSIGGDSCFEVQAPVLPSFQLPSVQLDIKVSPPHQSIDEDDEMLPLRGNTDLWDGLF